jgi:hypothetical protein
MNACFHILNVKLPQEFAPKLKAVGTANRGSACSVKTKAFPESLDTIDLRQSLLNLAGDQHTKA